MNPQDLVYRSNPESTPNTTVNAYIKNEYAVTPFVLSMSVSGNAIATNWVFSSDFTTSFAYFRMVMTDGHGTEVNGAYNVATMADFQIDTTTLDKTTDWLVQIFAAETTTSFEKPRFVSIDKTLVGAKENYSANFDLEQAKGTLEVYAELWENGAITVANAVVADAGTAAFGNVTANVSAYAIVTLKNTGTSPLQINSIVAASGDGSVSTAFGDKPALPLVIAAGETSAAYVKVNVDTTVGAGAITPIVLNIANNTGNVLYVVNFSATIV